MAELRTLLQQRLAIGDETLAIRRLADPHWDNPRLLRAIRPQLMLLAHGGPFVRWYDRSALEGLELEELDRPASEVAFHVATCVGENAQHLWHVDDDNERFLARLGIRVQERFGLDMPQAGEKRAMLCRHYATSVSRAYSEVAEREPHLVDTAVLFVMGVPDCERRLSYHAWNWHVDFRHGVIRAFEPQAPQSDDAFANVSALLYTFAAMRAQGEPVPGLRALVRRFDSLHGGTMLFHLARHPIDAASRREIVQRLARSHYERVVPTWREELEESDDVWGDGRVVVSDLVRFSD